MPEFRDAAVLVTGGAGFIGSHLVDALVEAGARRIRVVDDLSLGTEANLSAALSRSTVELTVADCTDPRVLGALTERFDLCFHLAVIPLPHSLVTPRENVDRNVAMTSAICELGREGGYRRLVNFSSSEVYGTAQSVPMPEEHPLGAHTPYAASKAASDLVVASYAKTFDLEAVTVRPFNTYGERQNAGAYAGLIPAVVRAVLAGEPVQIHGDGEQTRDMCYVHDTVAATLAIAREDVSAGEVFNIGTGEEASVKEMVRLILEGLGRPSHPVEHVAPRPGDVQRLVADTSRLREITRFEIQTPLGEGLARTVNWYLERASTAPA